jgi:phenylpyruvate tautomerase PptA (4-oxalocrotonate tautomerase family)
MKISEIQEAPKAALTASVTFITSEQAKRDLNVIAVAKGRTISEVVREITDNFLANNSDELQKLG